MNREFTTLKDLRNFLAHVPDGVMVHIEVTDASGRKEEADKDEHRQETADSG